MKAYRHDKP